MRRFETMIPVLIHIVAVRRGHIKPGIACQVRTVRIEFVHRVQSRRMVEHHIDNHRHAAFVALVDELLVHRLRAVCFIRRKIMVRRIAPVIVSVELANRHQLDSVHSKVLDIIQTLHQTFQRTVGSVVIYPQLIDYQVVLVRAFEMKCGIGPLVLRFAGLDDGHVSVRTFSCRIIQQIRIHFLRLILVIGVQHFLRIQIRDLLLQTVRPLHSILETIFLTRLQTGQCDPEIVTILV